MGRMLSEGKVCEVKVYNEEEILCTRGEGTDVLRWVLTVFEPEGLYEMPAGLRCQGKPPLPCCL